jgi:serine phosphatase RsbU (regulator of sigma subunit)
VVRFAWNHGGAGLWVPASGSRWFVTCIYAVFDPYDCTLTWANAGHLPPLVRTGTGEVLRLGGAESAPLGIVVGPVLEQQITLDDGDVLALYTDGLVERRDEALDEGMARAVAALTDGRHLATGALADVLTDQLLADAPDDDVAFLLYRSPG